MDLVLPICRSFVRSFVVIGRNEESSRQFLVFPRQHDTLPWCSPFYCTSLGRGVEKRSESHWHYCSTVSGAYSQTKQPTNQPTNQPTKQPTNQPTKQPTNQRNQPTQPTSTRTYIRRLLVRTTTTKYCEYHVVLLSYGEHEYPAQSLVSSSKILDSTGGQGVLA
jgi:hypothetical protein